VLSPRSGAKPFVVVLHHHFSLLENTEMKNVAKAVSTCQVSLTCRRRPDRLDIAKPRNGAK